MGHMKRRRGRPGNLQETRRVRVVLDVGRGVNPNKGKPSPLRGKKKAQAAEECEGLTAAALRADQVSLLAAALRGEARSVFLVAEAVFGVPLCGDGVYQRLERDGDLGQCRLCDRWATFSAGRAVGRGEERVFCCGPCSGPNAYGQRDGVRKPSRGRLPVR